MQRCPQCQQSRSVVPLMKAVQRGSNPRIMESEWGSMPVQRASLGGRRIADQVIGQLKRSSGGPRGALQQTTGVLLAVALAIFGIPAFIYGLFRLISASFLWLPVVLVLWLAGVVLLLVRATNPHVAPSPYREAMIRLADLSYCFECDMIFETSSGQVVPLEQLHETLYRRAARR